MGYMGAVATPGVLSHVVTKSSGCGLSTDHLNCTTMVLLSCVFVRIKRQINELQFKKGLDK